MTEYASVDLWKSRAGLLASFDRIGREGATAVIKIDGGRDAAIYTVVVSGGRLVESFYHQDGPDISVLLRDAVAYYYGDADS